MRSDRPPLSVPNLSRSSRGQTHSQVEGIIIHLKTTDDPQAEEATEDFQEIPIEIEIGIGMEIEDLDQDLQDHLEKILDLMQRGLI